MPDSGGQGSQNDDAMEAFDEEASLGCRRLARSWKSESGDQGSQNDDSMKGLNQEIVNFKKLARSSKSDSGGKGY